MRNMRESTIKRIERFDECLSSLKNFSHLSLDEIRPLLVYLYASIDFSEIYGNLNKYIIFLEKGMKTLLKFCKDKNIDP